jgi:mono/diheme cytochrome c family protein
MQAARLVGLFAFFVGSLGGSLAAAQEVGDARKGLAFAQRVCAECHGVAPGQLVPAAAPTFWAIANTPGMTAMALTVFLRTPHRNMPNLVISDSDRANVIAYILSLRDKR